MYFELVLSIIVGVGAVVLAVLGGFANGMSDAPGDGMGRGYWIFVIAVFLVSVGLFLDWKF